MIRRTILEWEGLRHGDGADEIPAFIAERIAAVAAASSFAGRHGNGVIEHGRKGLHAKGVVGVIAASGCALEILPKIDFPGEQGDKAKGSIRRRLVHMLAVALDMKIDVGDVTTLDWQRETLLEILIQLFSTKLIDAVRQGMPRQYRDEVDDLPVLRGRLDMARQFSTLATEPAKLACRFGTLSVNISLNQIMKCTVRRLAQVSKSEGNQRRLRELSFTYADIAGVSVNAQKWNEVQLDRTNSRWRELLDLARLLLGQRFQNTSAGDGSGFSLLFEMNVLFEQYVARTLQRALAGEDIRVVCQGGRLFCLENEDRRGLFQTRPDILLMRGNTVVQVIDTKWKRITASVDDPRRGISQGDVYQMMAYAQLYRCRRLTLLFPHYSGLAFDEGIVAKNTITGTDSSLETASVDISRVGDISLRLKRLITERPTVTCECRSDSE